MKHQNLLAIACFSLCSTVLASPIEQLTVQTMAANEANLVSQHEIDDITSKRLDTLQQYLASERELKLYQAYNRQLEQIISSQQQEVSSLQQQLSSIGDTELSVLPMLVSMLDTLTGFVAEDTPFLAKERQQRLTRLQTTLARADVSLADKYQQLLEAYLIEIEYSRTLETYRGDLLQGQLLQTSEKKVDYLRLGRMALYFITPDHKQAGLWQPQQQDWQMLSTQQILELKKAIRIAQKYTAPSLLPLPLPTMESHGE